jgi:hypothetical protein
VNRIKKWLFEYFEIVIPGSIKSYYDHDNYQLSDSLLDWIEKNKDFCNSLKLRHPRRFRKIPYLITSHTPPSHLFHRDEIIGLWYLDIKNYLEQKKPFFKQDFVVNKNGNSQLFTSFAQRGFSGGDYVEPVDIFFEKYGNNGKYYHKGKRWEHHYDDITDLPNNTLQELANKIIRELKIK